MTTLRTPPSRVNGLFGLNLHLVPRLLAAALTLGIAASLPAAETESKPPSTSEKQPDRAALEKTFQETLTKATFEGRWSLIKDGKLGPALEEKYTIRGVSKVGGEVWLVHARIQYGKTDATVPIPVKVKWAEDTPIITITDLAIPGVGTYTARVIIQEGMYAGTWSGGDYGGVLSGMIRK